MGRLFDVPGMGIAVSVLTRDHCPPHVHCECVAESWEARIAFSHLGDRIELMDVVAPKKMPKPATLNRLGEAISNNLTMCRREWWRIYADTCLDNQWLTVAASVVAPAPKRDRSQAKQVRSARYDAALETTTIEFADGSTRQIILMGEAR